MSAPTLIPQLAIPAVAASAVDADLARALQGRSTEAVHWRRPDRLTLLIPLTGYTVDTAAFSYGFDPATPVDVGDLANDCVPDGDDYLLRLYFNHYPQSPPSALFVNPDTLSFDPATDLTWLPDIQGSTEVFVHADYSGRQLVCCSSTLEFYEVNHNIEPRHQWVPGSHFSVLLNTLSRYLRPPYYKGRQGS